MRNETILNVFPSADAHHRLVVAVEQDFGESSRLVLRQETHSDAVGWFIQSRVAIEPEQVPGLKMALTSNTARRIQPAPRDVPRVPAILRFDDAVAGKVG